MSSWLWVLVLSLWYLSELCHVLVVSGPCPVLGVSGSGHVLLINWSSCFLLGVLFCSSSPSPPPPAVIVISASRPILMVSGQSQVLTILVLVLSLLYLDHVFSSWFLVLVVSGHGLLVIIWLVSGPCHVLVLLGPRVWSSGVFIVLAVSLSPFFFFFFWSVSCPPGFSTSWFLVHAFSQVSSVLGLVRVLSWWFLICL